MDGHESTKLGYGGSNPLAEANIGGSSNRQETRL